MFAPSLRWKKIRFDIEMAQKDRFYSPTSTHDLPESSVKNAPRYVVTTTADRFEPDSTPESMDRTCVPIQIHSQQKQVQFVPFLLLAVLSFVLPKSFSLNMKGQNAFWSTDQPASAHPASCRLSSQNDTRGNGRRCVQTRDRDFSRCRLQPRRGTAVACQRAGHEPGV